MIELLALQDPPPFVQYLEEAEALGRMSYMGGLCVGLGIVTGDEGKVDAAFEDFWRRATIAKTEGRLLGDAIQRGIDREKAASDLMSDLGPDDGSEQRRRRELQAIEYFGDGCGDLVINYPETFALAERD